MKIVNYIKMRPLKRQLFTKPCVSVEAHHYTLNQHTEVRWLSRGKVLSVVVVVVVVVVITPPLPRDGGTARTAIQVHAINLIEIRLEERWQPISNQS